MGHLFTFFNTVADLFFQPFEKIHPMWGMIAVSFLTSIVMLIIFRVTSNQRGIRLAKNKVSAYILEMRLFSHDLGKMLSALAKTIIANLLYLRFMVFPFVVIFIPVIIILIQTSYRYELRPLKPGEPALVKAILKPEAAESLFSVLLQPDKNISIETPALRIPLRNEINWRLSASKEGNYQLTIGIAGVQYRKSLKVGDQLTTISTKRTGTSFFSQLLHHEETTLPENAPLNSLQIIYPERTLEFIGFKFHWVVWFLLLSIVFSFALKSAFKVEL
jgi:uncharacterized membrane protein (DUF106 family)